MDAMGSRLERPRPDHAPGAARQPARRLRRDGCGPGALSALGEHQGAAGRLHRPLRPRRADGHAGRAHPGAPGRDAVGRRGRARRGAAARRVLDPQRPLPGRHPPARHHGDHAAVPRGGARGVRCQPRASRRCRRRGARQHARVLAHARGRGRRHPAHAAHRRGAPRPGRPDAEPAPARGRPARAAGGGPGGRRAGGRADRPVRTRHLPRRPRGDARLRRAPHARPDRRARRRRVPGDRRARGGRRRRSRAAGARDVSGDEIELDFAGPPRSTTATSTARSR